MPSMIEQRHGHNSVANSNKLFVIGNKRDASNHPCEVFDSVCNKFVAVKNAPEYKSLFVWSMESFSIGNKLVVIDDGLESAIVYDVKKGEWSEERFEERFFGVGCTVIHQINF